MSDIDEQLRKKGAPIHGRGLQAGLEYSGRFGLEFPMAHTGQVGTPGNYSDGNVEAHIRDWFDRRYGERQNIHMGPGRTVLLIRGDPWELHLPLIYGQVQCVAERDLSKFSNEPSVGDSSHLPTINVLALVEKLPQGLAAQLSDAECWHVLNLFRDRLDCMRALETLAGRPYMPEALADISAAVTHMFTVPPHFGQSKWSSCQAAEKVIKCVLKSRGVSFPRSHHLRSLADLAEHDGVNLDAAALSNASAAASVRYGETTVTLEEAVRAHYASLLLGRQIHAALRATV